MSGMATCNGLWWGDVVFSARDPTKTRISSLRSEISICVVPPSADSDLDIFLRS